MPPQPTIVLVEDDDSLAALLREYLARHHFDVACERNGEDGARRILASRPDLVILDLFLPGMNGLDVCRSVRTGYAGPILMLTASKSDADHVAGLELGADDFVTKPVDPRILLARIRTLLRRIQGEVQGEVGSSPPAAEVFQAGPLRVDVTTREVTFDDRMVDLTTMEFDVLHLLIREVGRVVTREDLYEQVCGIPYDGLDRGMDVHVSRIRRKLVAQGCNARGLKAIRGAGYLLALK